MGWGLLVREDGYQMIFCSNLAVWFKINACGSQYCHVDLIVLNSIGRFFLINNIKLALLS